MNAIELTAMQSSSLGERLRIARDQLGLTQEQAAKRIGVSRGLISQWENGVVSAISATHLSAAARALRVSLDWLLHGDGYEATREDPAAHGSDEIRDLLDAWWRLTASQRATQLAVICNLAAHNQALLDELAGKA